MVSFDSSEDNQNELEDYHEINMLDSLTWDKMGPAIQKGIIKRKKKNRRILIFWWALGLIIFGISVQVLFWKSRKGLNEIEQNKMVVVLNDELIDKSQNCNGAIIDYLHKISTDRKEKQVNNIDKEIYGIKVNNNEQISSEIRGSTDLKKTMLNNDTRLIGATSSEKFSDRSNDQNIQNAVPVYKEVITPAEKLSPTRNSSASKSNMMVKYLPLTYDLFLDNEMRSIALPSIVSDKSDPNLWQIEIAGGVNWWNYGLETQEANHITFNTQIGWQIDARVKRSLGRHLSLKSGLQLHNLRYISAFENSKLISVYQPKTVDVIFTNSLTGERSFSYRDSIPGMRNRIFQHYNNRTTLQIPLLIGFNTRVKQLNYSIHTGMSLNFLQHNAGRLGLFEGEVVDLPNRELYPNKLLINLLIETQVDYQLASGLTVFGRISLDSHFTYWLSLNSELEKGPKISYSSFGLVWSF